MVLHKIMESLNTVWSAVVHCIECLTPRALFESILEQLGALERCDNANDFAHHLTKMCVGKPVCIVLDKAERLRDLNDGIM